MLDAGDIYEEVMIVCPGARDNSVARGAPRRSLLLVAENQGGIEL